MNADQWGMEWDGSVLRYQPTPLARLGTPLSQASVPLSSLRWMHESPLQDPEQGAGFWLITSLDGELTTCVGYPTSGLVRFLGNLPLHYITQTAT